MLPPYPSGQNMPCSAPPVYIRKVDPPNKNNFTTSCVFGKPLNLRIIEENTKGNEDFSLFFEKARSISVLPAEYMVKAFGSNV